MTVDPERAKDLIAAAKRGRPDTPPSAAVVAAAVARAVRAAQIDAMRAANRPKGSAEKP